MAEARTALSVVVAPEEAVQVDNPPRRSLEQVILEQCDLLGSLLPVVIDGNDAVSIHKMRVTTRRLQAALELAGPASSNQLQKARRKLRRWRRALSRVRNYDVFLRLVEVEGVAGRSRALDGLDRLKGELIARREKGCTAARRRFAGIDLTAFKAGIGMTTGALADQPAEDESAARDAAVIVSPDVAMTSIGFRQGGTNGLQNAGSGAREARRGDSVGLVIGEHAAGRLERRLSQFQVMAALVQDDPDPLNAHRLRISGKRLRYLLEMASELGYGDVEPALRWLRLLQDRLGDWHDLAAMENELIGTVSMRKFLVNHLDESLGMLHLASRIRRKREALGSKAFPVHVPRSVSAVTRRLARSLRRGSAQ